MNALADSIELDRSANTPLYLQVAREIRALIRAGTLTPEMRLPATRTLAESLGVHRNTAVSAYRKLEQEGLVTSTMGSGTFVAATVGTLPASAESMPEGPARFYWEGLLRRRSGLMPGPAEILQSRDVTVAKNPILLNGAVPDSRQFPMEAFAACMDEVLAYADPHLLEYGPPEGHESLRAWIAEWLAEMGVVPLETERIFIVSGSQQGLDLLARLFLAPGDRVAVEVPTYTGAFMVLREAGARIIGIPVDEEGIILTALEEVLSSETIKFLYTMPCYQNPTGITLSPARRAGLLDLARRHSVAIVEDHYSSQLHYSGPPPRPLLADEPDGRVIHLGTFSKILFPGLRLGWMVVPRPLCRPMRQLRWATDLSSGTFTQQVLDRFCRSGRLSEHLERLCRVNAGRLNAMLSALADALPPEATWTRPAGGMTLWVQLHEQIDTRTLLRDAAERGLLFTPGIAFFPDGQGGHALRLSFNREDEKRITRGVRLLGSLIKERLRSGRRGDDPAGDAVPFL